MQRQIDDQDYLNFLPTDMHRRRYQRWKEEMLANIDDIIAEVEKEGLQAVMERRYLSPKDIALLVRLNFVSEEQAERFGMKAIEETAPA